VLYLRKLLAATFLLLLLCCANAQIYEITEHTIDIEIDGEGFGQIVERFYLSFPNEFQLLEFKGKYEELQTDLDKWGLFNERFRVHIGAKEEIKPGSGLITFNLEEKFLEIRYSLVNAIMGKNRNESTGRSIVFELNRWVLKEFLQGELYTIPKDTSISFALPAQATVERADVFDGAGISTDLNPVIRIPGGISTNTIKVKYTYWTQIAPSFSLAYLLKDFIENTDQATQTLALAVVLFFVAVVYWKRKSLGRKMEGFIVKHSKIS